MSTATPIAAGAQLLPEIPFVEVGQRIGLETFLLQRAVAHNLLDAAAAGTPRFGLRLADKISRAWLARTGHPYLAEIDEVAAALGRPGGHFFNVHYEWGCTTGVKSSEDGRSARLLRVLDWATNGLGRHIVAARSRGPAGDYVSLTWPGFTGVLQGMAPGRFSAALNQAPMDNPIGYLPVDWALNRFRVWRRPHLTPAHLLRRVFEQARDFAEARSLLTETPLSVPTIFTLAGLAPAEGAVIERKEEQARIYSGNVCAVNAWEQAGWRGRPRGDANDDRRSTMTGEVAVAGMALDWLKPPILNSTTRLALVADATTGAIVAQGYEASGAATAVWRYRC